MKVLLPLFLLWATFTCALNALCRPSTPFHTPFLWGFGIEGFPVTKQALEMQFEETRLSAQITLFYLQWPKSEDVNFTPLKPSLNAIWNNGGLPCLSWEPMFFSGKAMTAVAVKELLDGSYDKYLISVAKEIQSFGKPIILRFAHEMNLAHYHWGTTLQEYGPSSPKIYVQMFRYIVDLFRKEDIHNVLWAFCPNVESVPDTSWNNARAYYPGDEYVDILGMDGYNWNSTEGKMNHFPWKSFEDIFANLFKELKKISLTKPVIVFETASVNKLGSLKALWIKDALNAALKWDLLGIIWFQVKKERDWRINQHHDRLYLPLIREATSASQAWAKTAKLGKRFNID